METIRININSINANDERYQVRDPRAGTYGEKVGEELGSKAHIKNIVKALKDNPKKRITPIEVTTDPSNEGKYIIVDGFHRYAAFKQINKDSKGARYQQLRCVFSEDVPIEKALSINTEHTAKSLTANQRTELQWQRFLALMDSNPEVSIKQTSEKIGVVTSTVEKWRKERREFMEKGFFKPTSSVGKNEVTRYPILRLARQELIKDSFGDDIPETEGQLCDTDKELLATILKVANKAKEPDKLLRAVESYWGSNHKLVDYDADFSETDENKYEGF
ncbi:ParB N-terminal domain-containing protein [Pseudoalteromonas sp. T1lg88]|uniref:ParB N-terminal domain-containing protein n=1 Tax=Pseudoalteromonas sp. T1lg88 TaxID=2077104 RepID=UPI000CF6D084|nr:ParB N-terminal domain-containing protein [Pseudoalteromonas sp. T1lg88]